MMKYALTLALLLLPASLLADEPADPVVSQLLGGQAIQQHVDKDEPLHPYFAEKFLRGDAWAAWAIEHNRIALQRSRENTDLGREVRVNIGSPFYPFSRSHRGIQTYKSYSYYIGGSSSPVMIYNPYAPPK